MIYCEKFTDFNLAIIWEKKIKDWSRKKKEDLIKENWDQLKIEASCKNYTSHKNLVGQASSVLESARTDTQESLTAQTVVVRSQSHFTIVDINA
jgi:putative endonuclease